MLTKAEISRLRSLQDKRHRESLGLFVVEGEKVIGELVRSGVPFLELYATGGAAIPRAVDGADPLPVRGVTPTEMERISHFPTPSPLLAVGRIQRRALSAGALNEGLTLALDGIQDAGNVGTLLRIADWFKLDRVLLSPDCADLFNQKVINASMGSFARVKVYTAPLADALSGAEVPVLGCDLKGESVHTLSSLNHGVIVIGSEGRGISPEVRSHITRFITIPRLGSAESLNAGVAAGIVCDNLRRRQAG